MVFIEWNFDFSLSRSLTSNLLSMENFFAGRERFFSFIVFVAVLIFGFEQIIFSFTVPCTDIYWYILIKVNRVQTSLQNISQGLYWGFSPSNVDTYFHPHTGENPNYLTLASGMHILIIISLKLTVVEQYVLRRLDFINVSRTININGKRNVSLRYLYRKLVLSKNTSARRRFRHIRFR